MKEPLLPPSLGRGLHSPCITHTQHQPAGRYHSICANCWTTHSPSGSAKPGFERTRFFFSSKMPGYNHNRRLDEVTSPSRYRFHSFSCWEAVSSVCFCSCLAFVVAALAAHVPFYWVVLSVSVLFTPFRHTGGHTLDFVAPSSGSLPWTPRETPKDARHGSSPSGERLHSCLYDTCIFRMEQKRKHLTER